MFSAFALNKWLSSPSGVDQHVPILVFEEYRGRGVSDWYQSVVLFRAYLGPSVTVVVCLSWHHLNVTTSEFSVIRRSCANFSLFEFSLSGWNTRIRVGIVPQWWGSGLLDDFRHRIDTLHRAFPGNFGHNWIYLGALGNGKTLSELNLEDMKRFCTLRRAFSGNGGHS